MDKNVNGTSPALDLVQVCYSTVVCGEAGGNWNIIIVPLGILCTLAVLIILRKKR